PPAHGLAPGARHTLDPPVHVPAVHRVPVIGRRPCTGTAVRQVPSRCTAAGWCTDRCPVRSASGIATTPRDSNAGPGQPLAVGPRTAPACAAGASMDPAYVAFGTVRWPDPVTIGDRPPFRAHSAACP